MDEGSEEKRMSDIIDEQSERIEELETAIIEKDKKIANLKKDLHKRAEEILGLQTDYVVKDDEAEELDAELKVVKAKLSDKDGVFDGFINRINTMALAYGQLQQSDSGKMSMWAFATYIANQYGFAEKGVNLSVDIRINMMLKAEEAIPCGWIINELVSNCLEHAFPDGVTTGEPPEVKVEMGTESTLYGCQGRRLGVVAKDNCAVPMKLIVSDNGVGLPEDFNPFEAQSMGMKIVRSLVEQLGGTMTILRSSHGMKTQFIIRF